MYLHMISKVIIIHTVELLPILPVLSGTEKYLLNVDVNHLSSTILALCGELKL